jgi:hypothetical protein
MCQADRMAGFPQTFFKITGSFPVILNDQDVHRLRHHKSFAPKKVWAAHE